MCALKGKACPPRTQVGLAFLHQWSDSLSFTALGWHLAGLGNPLLVAWLQTLVYVSQAIRYALAALVERIGPRRAFAVGLVLGAIALLSMAALTLTHLAEATPLGIAFLFNAGLLLTSNQFIINAWAIYLPKRCPNALKGANARVRVAETTGDFVGDLFGPMLYQIASPLPFLSSAIARLSASTLIDRQPTSATQRDNETIKLRGILRVIYHIPELRRAFLCGLVAHASSAPVIAILPVWGKFSGIATALYGFFPAFFTLGLLMGNWATLRSHHWKGTLHGFYSILVGATLLTLLQPFAGLLGVLLLGTGVSAIGLQLSYVRQSKSPQSAVARVSAFSALFSSLVGALASLSGGMLASADVRYPLILSVFLTLIGILLSLSYLRFGSQE